MHAITPSPLSSEANLSKSRPSLLFNALHTSWQEQLWFFYTALQYQECSSSMWETWIQLPCLPAAAQTLLSLQIEEPAIRWDVEDAGACIPPSWGVQRCTSSFFLIKYFLFFFKQQGLPWQRQSTWKTGQGISPISRAWDTHGAGSTQKHITPPSCSHKRAAAGLVSSLGFFRHNMARRNASYKGPSRPSAKRDASMPRPLRGHLPCDQGAELPLPRVWEWKT